MPGVRPRRPEGRSGITAGDVRRLGSAVPRTGTSRLGSRLGMERDGFRLLLFLLIIVALSQVHRFFGLAALRPAFTLGIGTLAFGLLNPGRLNRKAVFRSWPPKVMLALAMMACISVPLGMSIGGSTTFIIERYANTLVIGFLVVLAIRHARDLYTLVWAFVLSCAWLVFLAMFVVGIQKGQALTYTSYDPNDVGLVLLVGLPLALVLFQTASSKIVRLVSLGTILGVGATIAISGSRGSFLGILAVGLALLVLVKGISVAKRVAIVAVAAAALVIAAPAGYWGEMQTITDPDDYNLHSDYGRMEVWKRGIGYMMRDPLTGIGIGNFQRAEGHWGAPVLRRQETGEGWIKWSAAHNSFLQAAAEMGVPGLILFASLVFGGMISMLRLRKRLPPGWKRGDPQERFLFHMALYLPVSFVAFAVSGFFLSFAYSEPIYLLAGFAAGMYAAVDVKMGANRVGGPRRGAPAAGPAWRRPPGWRVRNPKTVGGAIRTRGAVTSAGPRAERQPLTPKR